VPVRVLNHHDRRVNEEADRQREVPNRSSGITIQKDVELRGRELCLFVQGDQVAVQLGDFENSPERVLLAPVAAYILRGGQVRNLSRESNASLVNRHGLARATKIWVKACFT
jgi:hypothetical protein